MEWESNSAALELVRILISLAIEEGVLRFIQDQLVALEVFTIIIRWGNHQRDINAIDAENPTIISISVQKIVIEIMNREEQWAYQDNIDGKLPGLVQMNSRKRCQKQWNHY